MLGHVSLSEQGLQILGGSTEGRDTFHLIIAEWPGWKRFPMAARVPGGPLCSLFRAALWPSTIVPLFEQQKIVLRWEDGLKPRLEAILKDMEKAKLELDPPPSHHAPLEFVSEMSRLPMRHQTQAVRALVAMQHRALLSDDMGLGKTATSIYAWQQSGAQRLLVVCPKTVKRNWQRELWTTLKECAVYLIDGTPSNRANKFSEISTALTNLGQSGATSPSNLLQAAIINYDLLHRLPDRERDILISWCSGNYLILDESHYVKNKDAGRTRFILKHFAPDVGGALGRLCLSGTPVRNTLEDLWAQIEICRPGVWSSHRQYEKFHLVRAPLVLNRGTNRQRTINPVRQSKNVEQLNAVINTLQIRRKKEDVLNLPPKVYTYPEFELDPPTLKVYCAMREMALIDLADLGDDEPIFSPHAKSALEVTMRCEQIAQGFLGGIPEGYLSKIVPMIAKNAVKIKDRPGHLIFPKSAKIQHLIETVTSIILQGNQAVVFTRFNSPLAWLVEQFEDAETMTGANSMEQRDDIIQRFQKGGIPVLFVQVKIAEGFNLTRGQDAYFYGRDWSPAINAQAADRLHRIGQTGTVQIQVPIVIGTFEEYLHKKLKAKDADATQALKAMTIGELRKAL